VPGELAKAMVAGGGAVIAHSNGKVKSIKLLECARSHAHRIGDPTPGPSFGVRFTRRVLLDGGFIVFEHHPRSTYEW
jgi:hypothetical protein